MTTEYARIDLNNGSNMSMEFQSTDDMLEWAIQRSNPFLVTLVVDEEGKRLWNIAFRGKTGIPPFKMSHSISDVHMYKKALKEKEAQNCWHHWTQDWVK